MNDGYCPRCGTVAKAPDYLHMCDPAAKSPVRRVPGFVDAAQRTYDLASQVRLVATAVLLHPSDWLALDEWIKASGQTITHEMFTKGSLLLFGLPCRPSDEARRGQPRMIVE